MRIRNTLTAAALAVLVSYSAVTLAGGTHPGEHKHGEHSHDEGAIGQAGVASKVNRTVTVDMTDAMRFVPEQVSVKQGETIRFVVKNSGKVRHEFVLGTEAALKEHYQVMLKFPEMEHADANMVTVVPGQTGEVIWQFTKAGKVDFGCLQPGHYDAGMKGAVAVAGKATKQTDGHTDHKH